jgi:hypothetical protein
MKRFAVFALVRAFAAVSVRRAGKGRTRIPRGKGIAV